MQNARRKFLQSLGAAGTFLAFNYIGSSSHTEEVNSFISMDPMDADYDSQQALPFAPNSDSGAIRGQDVLFSEPSIWNHWRTSNNRAKSLYGPTSFEYFDWINTIVNRACSYSTDPSRGTVDHWDHPWEFLQRQTGDCEDFALTKYALCRTLGLDTSRIWLGYGTVMQLGSLVPHLWLFVHATSGPGEMIKSAQKGQNLDLSTSQNSSGFEKAHYLVLDNYAQEIVLTSERRDLAPRFMFNEQGIYQIDSGVARRLPRGHIKPFKDWLSRSSAVWGS